MYLLHYCLLCQLCDEIGEYQKNSHNNRGDPEDSLLEPLCFGCSTDTTRFTFLWFFVDTVKTCNKKTDSKEDEDRLVGLKRPQASDPCTAYPEHHKDKGTHAAGRCQQCGNNCQRAKREKSLLFHTLTGGIYFCWSTAGLICCGRNLIFHLYTSLSFYLTAVFISLVHNLILLYTQLKEHFIHKMIHSAEAA